MAEQFTDPLRYLTEKLFCPKCGSVFKNLKQLSCLHSFCLPCLEAIQETCGQHVIITCPSCEQKSTIQGEMAADLPNSPYVASLEVLVQIMSHKLSLLKCALCAAEPAATLSGSYCVQCGQFCCENCVTRHNANHVDHDLISLEDSIAEDAESPLKPCTKCPEKHHENKEVELFCAKCEMAICQLCSSTKHENHPGKEVLEKIAVEHKSQMEALIDVQLKEAKKKMEEVRRIDEECEDVSNQETEVENDVINFFQAIHACLEEKKKNILTAIRDEALKSRVLLKRQKKLIQIQEEVIRFTMKATRALLMHTTSVEVIALKKSLDTIVKEVKEEEQAHCEPEREPLQMKFVKAQESLDILKAKGIGFLQLQSNTVAHECCAEGSGIKEATVGLRAEFTLKARNSGGDPYYNKRDQITVEAKDKDGQDIVTGVRIQDFEDGTYKISYFPKEAGELEASVKINGEDIHGSPFPVEVKTRPFEIESAFGQTYGDKTARWGLAVSDDDEIAMTVTGRKAVQLFKSDLVTMFSFTKPGNREKDFHSPTGVMFDKNGNILVADSVNGFIHTFSRKLQSREYEYKGIKFGGKGKCPKGLSIDKNGNIIVADTEHKLIEIVTPEGDILTEISPGFFMHPIHCVQCDKYLVVSDTCDHAIKVFDKEGAFLYKFGKEGNGVEELKFPRCLAVDKVGHLLVCDHGNNRIQIFELQESSVKLIGTMGKGGNGKVELQQPFSVGVLSDGRIVVNDVGNKRMLKIA